MTANIAADLLKKLDHIPSASFQSIDSDSIQMRAECTPGTRTQILEMLRPSANRKAVEAGKLESREPTKYFGKLVLV